jgi:hypothetical protein
MHMLRDEPLPRLPPVSMRLSGADQLMSTSLWQWKSCPSSLQMSMSLNRSLLKNSDMLGAMPLFVLMVMLDTSSSCMQGKGGLQKDAWKDDEQR